MDILIKNMEMPDGEDIVLLVRPNGDVRKITRFKLLEFEGSAKAVALPEHGRLGDLDLLEEWMRKKHKEHDCPFNIDAFLFALKKFPTIVEANNGTDN